MNINNPPVLRDDFGRRFLHCSRWKSSIGVYCFHLFHSGNYIHVYPRSNRRKKTSKRRNTVNDVDLLTEGYSDTLNNLLNKNLHRMSLVSLGAAIMQNNHPYTFPSWGKMNNNLHSYSLCMCCFALGLFAPEQSPPSGQVEQLVAAGWLVKNPGLHG